MSKAGSFLGGLGMGAAAGYAKKRSLDASEARLAARIAGKPLPADEPSMLDGAIGKVKEFLTPSAANSPSAPVADNRPTFNVSLAEQAAMASPTVPEMPAAEAPSPETVAFNDDATVPNEPLPFTNSYD